MVFFHILITKDACKANAWVQNTDNYMQILKKESPPYLEKPDKAVIALFRNEYTKSIVLAIICFSRIRRIVFAFHPILFGKHLQI